MPTLRNRRYPFRTVVLTALIGLFLLPAATSVTAGEDVTAPEITSFTVAARRTKSPDFTRITTINVNIQATDDVKIFGYYLSDIETKPPIAFPGPWLTTKPTSFVLTSRDGPHIIRLWVIDAAQNVSPVATDRIFLDHVFPRPTIVRPGFGESLAELKSIGGTVGELQPSSGVARGDYAILRRRDCSWWDSKKNMLVKGLCGVTQWQAINTAPTTKSWSAFFRDFTEPGKYALTVRFIDRAGNVGFKTSVFYIR